MKTIEDFKGASVIDLRDVTERVDDLREERDACDAEDYEAWQKGEGAEELATLTNLLDDLAGCGGDHQWEGVRYPLTLINDSHFTDAMRELVEDIGDMPHGMPSYLAIDWDATADNLRVDYSSVEFDGDTFWYR